MFTVDFNKLPGFNKLFLDYVSSDETAHSKITPFFSADYKENEGFFKVIDSKLHNYNSNRYFDKHVLYDILKQQNVSFGGNEKTATNIELLDNDNTFAVVTGQQVGLYTGPVYTILKSLTTIKLAENLKRRFPNYNFVPIFWLGCNCRCDRSFRRICWCVDVDKLFCKTFVRNVDHFFT